MARSIFRVGDTRLCPVSAPRPDDTPIVAALRYGVTAPSAHNTQPWRVELVSDVEARVSFDPDRMLPETDPPGRHVHISHGTFAEMTAIAATSLGFEAELDILAEGEISIPESGTRPTVVIRLSSSPASSPTRCSHRCATGPAVVSRMVPAVHRPGTHDWITTGRADVRAQLAASELGLRFQPTSQVLQEFPQMDELRIQMERLAGVTEPAKLQMLVRVGRTQPPALSPRRDPSAIFER